MNAPEQFQLKDEYAYYRLEGRMSIEEATALAARAVAYCAEQKIGKLLINATGLTGLGSLSLADRFFTSSNIADAGQGSVNLAMVVQPELIHPQRFGAMVAQNRGMLGDCFDSESTAEAWLLASDLVRRSDSRPQDRP